MLAIEMPAYHTAGMNKVQPCKVDKADLTSLFQCQAPQSRPPACLPAPPAHDTHNHCDTPISEFPRLRLGLLPTPTTSTTATRSTQFDPPNSIISTRSSQLNHPRLTIPTRPELSNYTPLAPQVRRTNTSESHGVSMALARAQGAESHRSHRSREEGVPARRSDDYMS